MSYFRFENLEIWQLAAEICIKLFKIADRLDGKKMFRVAEQLRAAALGMTNNIAEGSGSDFPADFNRFLNFARRSIFECANIVIIISKINIISNSEKEELLEDLDKLSRKIYYFKKTLTKKKG